MPQTITPYLLYEDVAGALDWLTSAFGFEEVLRLAGDDGDPRYDAYDLEGQLWSFATRTRDVAPEDWGATRPE